MCKEKFMYCKVISIIIKKKLIKCGVNSIDKNMVIYPILFLRKFPFWLKKLKEQKEKKKKN